MFRKKPEYLQVKFPALTAWIVQNEQAKKVFFQILSFLFFAYID